jgi:2,3-bisphosphoglycerate-independent phosphoglycerate mutase
MYADYYDETYKNVKVVYNKDNITETEVLEKQTKLKLELQRLRNILTLLFSFPVDGRAFHW